MRNRAFLLSQNMLIVDALQFGFGEVFRFAWALWSACHTLNLSLSRQRHKTSSGPPRGLAYRVVMMIGRYHTAPFLKELLFAGEVHTTKQMVCKWLSHAPAKRSW